MDELARRISQGPQGPIQFSVSKQIKEKSVPQFNILLLLLYIYSLVLCLWLGFGNHSQYFFFLPWYYHLTITNNCFYYLEFWLSLLKNDCAIWIRKFDWSDVLKLMCIIVCPSINIKNRPNIKIQERRDFRIGHQLCKYIVLNWNEIHWYKW